MKKLKTKTLLTISLICCLTVLTACTNPRKERRALFIKNIEHQADLRMDSTRFDLDANGDNVLTCTDADIIKTRLMDRFDFNADQSLSSKEYQEVRLSQRRFVYFDFNLVDKDQNNSISRSEFLAIPNDRLKSFDLNKNCEISDAELKKAIISSILQDGNSIRPRRKKGVPQSKNRDRKGQGGHRGNRGN